MEYSVAGLEEFTNYSIAVFGSTEAGDGMSITITVQTLAASKLNTFMDKSVLIILYAI